MGVAFDGDFDRCFFFDGAGQFVPGEYVVGLLAAIFLDKEAGGKIVHDPRVIWNTQDIVASHWVARRYSEPKPATRLSSRRMRAR